MLYGREGNPEEALHYMNLTEPQGKPQCVLYYGAAILIVLLWLTQQ